MPTHQQAFTPLRFVLLIVAAVFAAVAFMFLSAPQAHASQSTQCEAAVCYATTSRYAVSDWQSAMERDNDRRGTVAPANPRQMVAYSPCLRWTTGRAGAGYSTWDYPADDSGTFTCWARGGITTSTACPPLNDRASNGLMVVWRVDDNNRRFYSHARCLYPTDAYAPTERRTGSGKVYTGGEASFYRTGTNQQAAQRANLYHGAGIRTDRTGYINRSINLSNPERYIGSWKPRFDARTGSQPNGDPLYGFYRVDWKLDYRVCHKWEYPSWLSEPARYDCSTRGADTSHDPYTYSCSTNPPLRAGINTAASFAPSACNTGWECRADNELTVGGHTGKVTVLRNGQAITVANPTPAITQTGNQVSNIRWEYRNSLRKGSTPMNPDADLSDDDQWFYTTMGMDNKWEAYKPTDEVAFYWASDGGSSWSYSQQYAFTASFRVPAQGSLSGGTIADYAADRVVCDPTKTSPEIVVVRAANAP